MRKKVQLLKAASNADLALTLLISRLAALGVITLLVIVVLIASSAEYQLSSEAYSPLFNSFFQCATTALSCDADVCLAKQAQAQASRPTIPVISLQLASMSMITVCFGVFFSAQSLSRLYREYKDGSLQRKIKRVVNSKHYVQENLPEEAQGSSDHNRFSQQVAFVAPLPRSSALSPLTSAAPVTAYQMKELNI